MESILQKYHHSFHIVLLIFICFSLVSAGYLSWLYRLIDIMPGTFAVDLASEVAGYLFQAAGIGLFAFGIQRWPGILSSRGFLFFNIFYIMFLIPAVLSDTIVIVLCSGFLMNLFCGIISAYYIHMLAGLESKNRQATVFGLAYGLSTIALWLVSFSGNLLSSDYALIFYALLVILTVIIYDICSHDEAELKQIKRDKEDPPSAEEDSYAGLLILAFVSVVLLSYVKNLGFIFPASDIGSRVNLELSRVFYGAGLIIAGYISDRSRRYGAVFCMTSLIIPFLMLVLTREPLPALLLWSLNYFFFGFVSVFRIVLFTDISREHALPFLAGFGLLSGRIGDAAGNYTYILLGGKASILVIVAATLFILTVFIFFQLYHQVYMPVSFVGQESLPKMSEQERFETFCQQYNCSRRERDILRSLLLEQSNAEIADTLFISESTVKFHIHNLLKKTGCKNRIELLALYHLQDPSDAR